MYQFTTADMQSTATSLFSAYASVAAFMMMFRSLANELVPEPVRSYLQSLLHYFFNPITSSNVTVTIEEQAGMSRNEVYDAAEIYLRTKIGSTTDRFKLSKTPKQKTAQLSIQKGEEIQDTFDSLIHLTWKFVAVESQHNYPDKCLFELSFNRKFRDRVVEEYVPHVLARAKEIRDSDKVVKLYTTDAPSYDDDGGGGVWGSITLDHPSSFETLAMEPEMKKAIIDDLERFVKRRDYYKKVGKAWKRGYLLYGPPGTGKSSLIAAMANYLKFDVYDLELTSLYSNSELRRILVSTTNRSIIVIEDIDCSAEMQDRQNENYGQNSRDSKLTLSGLLNFIDGLWSSCGDERIIVFTTNHKEKLDPALLRPGRMDLHIHMSYCTYQGFRLLASNYLGIDDHYLFFKEIEDLLETVLVTPAEIAEELMKSEDVDIALAGVVKFLKCKKVEASETKEEKNVVPEGDNIVEEQTDGSDNHEPDYLDIGRTEERAGRSCRRRVGRGFRGRGRGRGR